MWTPRQYYGLSEEYIGKAIAQRRHEFILAASAV